MTMDAYRKTSTYLIADCVLWLLLHHANQKVVSKKCDIINPFFMNWVMTYLFALISIYVFVTYSRIRKKLPLKRPQGVVFKDEEER